MQIKPIVWTDPQKPNDTVHYDHITAQTPFGQFLITWKGWKDSDSPTIDETPWGEFGGVDSDLEGAKAIAEAEYNKQVLACLSD